MIGSEVDLLLAILQHTNLLNLLFIAGQLASHLICHKVSSPCRTIDAGMANVPYMAYTVPYHDKNQ